MRWIALVLLMCAGSVYGQIDIRQLIPDSTQYMVPVTDSLLENEYYQKYYLLSDPHFFLKDDSVCVSVFSELDTACVPLDSLGCFTVIYGGGDSTRTVCAGDTMYIDYGEPGVGGGGDTTYYWIYTTNGGAPDTVIQAEVINFVESGEATITQAATNLTFHVPNMRDTCRHTLTQLTDSTAQLTDCLGSNRGIIEFNSSACLQSALVSNGASSDTIFLTYCDGANPKDTIVVYHATFNDSYADSAGVWNNDTVMVYRVDTSGIIDSFPIVVPKGSLNDTIYQALTIDTTTGLFTLSDDPTATPDLLILPWKDAINDDYSANYIDKIRHNNFVGINTYPIHTLDIKQDTFNLASQRIYSGLGTSAIRLEDSSVADQGFYDIGMISGAFLLKQRDPGIGTGRIVIEVDSGGTERALRIIGPSENNGIQMQDYGAGDHVDSVTYIAGWNSTGKLREVSLSGLTDSLYSYIVNDSIDSYIDSVRYDNANDTLYIYRYLSGAAIDSMKVEIPDSVSPEDADWYVFDPYGTEVPYDINDHIYTRNKVTIGDGTNINQYQVNILHNGNNFALRTGTEESFSQWLHEIEDDTSTTVNWITAIQSNLSRRDWRLVNNTAVGVSGVYLSMKEGYESLHPALIVKSDGDIGLAQYRENRQDGTQEDVTRMFYVSNDTIDGELFGTLKLATVDTLKRVLGDYDFVRLHGDSMYYGSTQRDSLLPLTEQSLDSLLWRAGRIRLGDTTPVKYMYDSLTLALLKTDEPMVQTAGKINAIDAYHWNYPYVWLRNDKADFFIRNHNQDNVNDTLPSFLEIGAISWHHPQGEAVDTSNRKIFAISGQGNESAFVLYKDSLKLGDYTTDRTDTLITVADITKFFVPTATGVLGVVTLDTINAALSVAAGSPDLLFWDFKEDSLGILWSGLADTGFVDLSKFNVSITGDSIYQGDSVYALPQGADSLGLAITNDYLVLGTGTKAPKEVSNLYLSGVNSLKVPNEIRVGNPGITTDATFVSVGHGRTGDGNAWLDLYSKSDGTQGSRMIRSGGTNGVLNFQNWGTGNINFYRNTATIMQTMNGTNGQVSFQGYGSGALDGGSMSRAVMMDVNGTMWTNDASQLGTFLSTEFAPTFSVPNPRIPIGNGNTLTSDSRLLYASGSLNTNRMDLTSSSGLYWTDPGATNQWRMWQATNSAYLQPQTIDGNFYVRAQTGAHSFSFQPGTQEFGINILDPLNNLHVAGTARITGSTGTPTGVVGRDASGQISNVGLLGLFMSSGTLTANDQSASNELQNLSIGTRTSTTYPINISSGAGTSLGVFTSALAGLVPSSGGGTTNFLRADGSWVAPSASGGGIYGGDGTLPSSDDVLAQIPASSSFAMDYNGGSDEFAITSSSTYLGAHNGPLTLISSGSDVDITSVNNNIDIVAGSGSGDDVNITGYSDVNLTGTNGSVNVEGIGVNGTTATASTIMQLNGGNANIVIGSGSDDGVTINSSSTGTADVSITAQDDVFITSSTNSSNSIISLNGGGGAVEVEIRPSDFVSHILAGFGGNDPTVEVDVTGDIEYTGTIADVSDRRLKQNITPIDDAYKKVLSLDPVSFQMKESPEKTEFGYIAQDYQKTFPQQVRDTGGGFLGIEYQAASTYTTAAVQQLIREKEQMQRTIDDMRDVITSQEDRLLKLEKMILKK